MVLATSRLRTITAILFLNAAASSLATPTTAIFAKRSLDCSNEEVAVYFAAGSLGGLLMLLVSAPMSDRTRSRDRLAAASLAWAAVGYVGLAEVTGFWGLLVAGILFFGASSVGTAQVLTMAREVMPALPDRDITVALSLLRAVYSVGWVTGPAVAGLLYERFGPAWMFRLAAIALGGSTVLSALALRGHATAGRRDAIPASRVGRDDASDETARAPIALAFVIALVLLSAGNILRIGLVPLQLIDEMQATPRTIGAALGVTPFAELPLLVVASLSAARFGSSAVLVAGAAAATLCYSLLAAATEVWMVFVAQAIYALYVAATVGVGVDFLQRLMPARPGVATSWYFAHENAATIAGSVLAPAAIAALGIRVGFLVPTVCCVVGMAIIVVVVRQAQRRLRAW